MDQSTKGLQQLTSMFPGIDAEVCEAVLSANNGDMGASITTLLGMSDPNFKSEEAIPIQADDGFVTSSSRLQIERDEELARQLAAEEDREYGAPPNPVNQQPQQQQSSPSGFPDFSEELPIIKEKIVQAADTTKKKVKEWYDKFKQSRDDQGQSNTPLYTSLPGDEADNHILDEDFLNNHSRRQNNPYISPLRSRPEYGSYGTDVTRDIDRHSNREPIKIIRSDQNNNSLINDLSEKEVGEESVAPYKIYDEETDIDNSNESKQTHRTEKVSTGGHNAQDLDDDFMKDSSK
ncbi:15286_t:CDS:2 [Acaulospora morrowiae]|uniref:15286_t:CDS:1 n=1 Tax=Acaulospora morrowiae TaxID=94023 RepID=A0A9N9HX70_9GLOM|nr:15286_t:CDS:2 [Acaulospora morrowiae]